MSAAAGGVVPSPIAQAAAADAPLPA